MRILAAAQRYVAEEPVTVTFRRPRSQRSPDGQCSGGPGYSGQERPARHWALVEFPFSHAAIHCIAASALTRNNAFPVAVSWARQSLKKNLHRPRGLARCRLGGCVGGRFKRIGRVGNRTWVLLRLDHCGAPPSLSGRRVAASLQAGANRREQSTSRSDQCQNNGGILRRICAAGLGVKRGSNQ